MKEGERTGQMGRQAAGMDKCLHRVYRTVCTVCMLQSDTSVSAWLIQTAQTVRSNLHSTICPYPLPASPSGPGL